MKPTALSALLLPVLPALLVGCASATPASTDTPRSAPAPTTALPPTPAPVTLEYIGNSCILITAPDGTRVVSDPYHDSPRPPGLDRLPSDLKADAVTVSHSHPDHNNAEAVGGTPQVLTGPGTYNIGMVKVTGYGGYEGSPSGPSRNPHTVFAFEIGGVKIVQMGDSGPITQSDVLAGIENADVLLANIDGYVIPPDQIVPFVQRAKVRTFIPTHYSLKENARWSDAPTIEEFLKTLPSDLAVVREGSQIQVRPNMPKQVAVLTPLALGK
jgi:L-ascorbate metabolism protein UlaG (beta-lactamase superfamily)